MINPLEQFFLQREEPDKSCLLALRDVILELDSNISLAWKYGMPFFCYKGKMCCYLWVHKTFKQPYIGFVEGKQLHHPELLQEKRARMKILLIDANKDIPIKKLNAILKEMLYLYKSGKVKV
jgi:hypothetical protein